MSDTHDDDDDDFGQTLPPLHIYLKRVLDKHPEGGQILKELVQNADDAGARRVVILYDKTQHPTDSMWSDSLHDFNGPSLYVYNDATFQDPDWKNIQHPEQSGDPTKVGRFGLGFISIYHLTDIPSVLSGNQIGFLDPHERYFVFDPHIRVKHIGKRGKKWRLSADILDKYPDQFNPYLEPLFNCSRTSFENGHFGGTIFRFPLRNSKIESQVSSAVYDDKRVHSLFQSYQVDAEISLLFLKNVESVALYEKTGATEAPKLLFSVEISEANRQLLRSKRKQFLAGVTQPAGAKAVCRMDINKQIQVNQHGIKNSCNKYLTINIVKKQDISHELEDLAADKELKLLPWVGVSMLVDGNEKDRSSGRVFCFLPLPESERTGLPIHVHGYFGLGDNRRSIKWPDRESTYDKAAIWNQLLVHEVFPDAYQTLIINAISDGLSADDVYKSWPDVSNLNGKWKEGVKIFLGKIKNEAVLFTNTNGGVWKKPADILIHQQNDELIQSILEKKGFPVARVPDNVRRSLEWGGILTKVVTPAIVRSAIRGDSLAWMNRKDKLHLLRYILVDYQFGDLQQIFLLPLADESFTSFSSSSSPVYISTSEIPRDLFPNMSSRFVADDVPPELRKAVGRTQLRQLTCSMVPRVLKEALPWGWIQGSSLVNWTPESYQQPDMNWLERIWCWLTRNASYVSLSNLSSVSLIPLDESGSTRRLARIDIHRLILRQKISGNYGQSSALPESMCSYLETLGAIVLRDDVPSWIAQHPRVDTIIKSPDIDGFTAVLDSCWSNNAVQNVDTGGDGLRSDIRSFFKHATLSNHCKVLLRLLPVFNTTDMTHASVAHVKVTVPQGFHGIPVHRLRQRFLLEKDDSDELAFKLGARRISENELLCTYILPDVGNKYYNSDETNKIMLWVLERPQYDSTVRNLSFVTTKEGVCRPTELFTPDDPRLQLLFKDNYVFPTEVYATGRPLQCLRRVGIRHLLDDDPYNLFQPDEIIVYKSPIEDSDSKTDGNTGAASNVDSAVEGNNDWCDAEEYSFVFARIMEKVSDKSTSRLKRWYRIDVGESKPIVVSVLKLYRFRRPRKPTFTTVPVFTGDPDSATEPLEHRVPPPRNLKDAKNRIREAIREVLTLPQNEQKEAIHRLYKTWHPDKNPPEQIHLYNEAFQFLKELLARKEKEGPGGSSTCFRDYSSRNESWESDIQREREHESSSHRGSGRRRQRVQLTSGSSYVKPLFSSATPDLQNARKWYRQAEEELCKTQEQFHSDLKAPWRTAFYLHQVVEIALRAAQFYQDGKPYKSSTDLMSLVIDLTGAKSNDLVSKVGELIRLDYDFHKPRYPDSVNDSSSMQIYADFIEAKGLQICTEILHIVRDMIGIEKKSRASASNNSHKRHQSNMPKKDEENQSNIFGQDKEHQSTGPGQDEEHQSADEEHQFTRPRQDKQHQPTIPEKKHSGYTNVPDELTPLDSMPTRTRTKIKIGSSGGTINLLGNTVQLKIPEGALQSEVEIELSVLSPKEMCPPLGDKQFVIAPIIQCKPEGLQFRKPVKLTVPHCGVNVSAKHIQIWRKDKDNTGWGKDFDGAQNEEKESVKVESKRIRMRIRHFTWYATVLNFVTNFFRGSPEFELNLIVFRSNLRDSKSMWMRFYAVQDYQIESVVKEEAEGFTNKGFRKRHIDVQPNGKDLQIKVMDVRDLQGEDVWEPNEAVQEISYRGLNKGGVDASCTFKFTKKEDTVHGVQGIWIAEQEDNDSEFKEEHFCVDLETSPTPSDSRRRSLGTTPAVGGADGGCALSDPENVGPRTYIYNPVYNPTIVHGNSTSVSGNQENYDKPTIMPSSRSLPVEAAPDTPAIEDHD